MKVKISKREGLFLAMVILAFRVGLGYFEWRRVGVWIK